MGIDSRILVENRESAVAGECEYFSRLTISPEDGLIYHHSIGTGLTLETSRHRGPSLLIYHNITPPDFFLPYNRSFAGILKKGIIDLGRLSSSFDMAVGDSSFNRQDLDQKGFPATEQLPILVDPSRWALPSDRDTLRRLNDGRKNIIFVGRLAPNKKQEDLVEMFFHLRKEFPASRLILVGDGAGNASYVHLLYERIRKYGLSDHVEITGKVSENELHAYYKSADLFVSMSEHEGFGVPLIESMWFDIPVLAFSSTAVPETMQGAGVLFTEKSSFAEIAHMAGVLLENEEIRSRVIQEQRNVRELYSPQRLLKSYRDLFQKIFLSGRKDKPVSVPEKSEKKKPRIAFVVRRTGIEVNGGPDRYCLDLAQQMKSDWEVHILTTCALDPNTRENFYPEGIEELGGVWIHRFPVDRPVGYKQMQFLENSVQSSPESVSPRIARRWLSQQGPASGSLLRYLRMEKENYDAFFFFSYKTAVTFQGLPIVQDRAYLFPSSTGEELLQLPVMETFFSRPRGFFFMTREEEKDLIRRFPFLEGRGHFAGTGLHPPGNEDPLRFSVQHAIYPDPFLLFLDEIDEKGALPVARDFIRFRNETGVRMKLVFAGPPYAVLPAHPDIHVTGHLSEETIRDAISGALAVVIPRPRDNPPLSVLEAWNRNRPVLMDGHSEFMVQLCRSYSGGLWYRTYEEFQEAILFLLENPDYAKGVATAIREPYNWEHVIHRIREVSRRF